MLNLTPHAISVMHGGFVVTYPPSGMLAKVSTVETLIAEVDNVPIVSRTFGEVEGLPTEGTPCLVSALVLAACPKRRGVYAPDTGVTADRLPNGHVNYVTRLVAA